MNSSTNKILVVGLGNRLRGDDGLGVKVVEKLKQKEWGNEVSILNIGSSPINYLQEISHSKKLIAVDAIQGEKTAGSIYQLTLEEIKQQPHQTTNAHSYSLPQVIALAKETTDLPQEVTLFGLEPSNLQFADQLSSPIKKKLPQLIKKIKTTIKNY